MEMLKKFLKEEDGVTAIEYTLIAVLIALGIVVVLGNVRGWIENSLGSVANLPENPST